MTPRSVQIHPDALEEAKAAVEWYRERSPRAAESFVNELSGALQRISEHPGLYFLSEFGTRRVLLHKFPYLVVFRETANGIEVIAVAHGRRRPGYWRNRVTRA
jgi:plasmid stabilization system protein ParE